MAKLVGRIVLTFTFLTYKSHRSFSRLHSDFKEFLVGFLLTTKGSMEEKLDYTFQIYGKILTHFLCKKDSQIVRNAIFRCG